VDDLRFNEEEAAEMLKNLGSPELAPEDIRAPPWKDVMTTTADTLITASVDGWLLPDTTSYIFKSGRYNPVSFITVANLGEITGPANPSFFFPGLIPGYTNMLANAGKAE
jgi:hypothetical protein